MGHAEVMALHDVIARYWWQQGYDVLNPIGWDSFGLPAENAAIKRDEHPATYTYANIETQAESFRRYGIVVRLVAAAAHLRPGVLPLDPVAVPAVPRARAGLPQVSARSTGAPTTRRCWPTSRSCRACASAAAPRSPSASCRSGTSRSPTTPSGCWTTWSRWRTPGPTGCWRCSATGSAAPRARTSTSRSRVATSRSRSSPRARTRCTARRSSWSPPTPSWPTRSARRSSARPSRPTWTEVRKETDIDRLSTDRPEDRRRSWAATRSTRSTASGSRCGRPTTCWPTTAPARSWRCPRTTSATWTSRRRSTCRCGASSTPGEDDPEETYVATVRRRRLRQLRARWTG